MAIDNSKRGEIAAPHFWTPMKASMISCSYEISGSMNNQIWSFKDVNLVKGDIVFSSNGKTVANLTGR